MTEDINKHVNSHIVTIHRLGNFLSKAQAKSSVGFFEQSKESIGSYFASTNSQKVGSGLSMDEEKLLMPEIVNLKSDDREFRKMVNEYFNDITTNVPFGTGVSLQIGLSEDNTKPLSEKNMPLHLYDYVRYRHAKGHPWVALSKDGGEGNILKRFYIFDKEAMQDVKNKSNKEKDAAQSIFFKIKEEPALVDQMLTLLGTDVRDFSGKDKDNKKQEKLRELADTRPMDFKKIYDQDDLEVRAWIGAMVTTGILKKYGERLVYGDSNEEFTNSVDEAIFFFKDEENSGIVNTLKARLQEASLKAPEAQMRKTVVS